MTQQNVDGQKLIPDQAELSPHVSEADSGSGGTFNFLLVLHWSCRNFL